MNFYTIPATSSFCDVLAAYVDGMAADYAADVSKIKIFLPTRRAKRTLQESFLRLSQGEPRILPIMQAVGDAETEEIAITMAGYGQDMAHLTLPIDPMRRQLILARLLEKAWKGQYHYTQALDVAAELGRFIDQLHTEEKTIDGLADLVDKRDFADHWQMTVDFLNLILRDLWPAILAEEGKVDPGQYRSQRIGLLTQFYRENPPQHPVIIAGSTGSIPATREFIKTIAAAPNGHIILPALDCTADDNTWLDIHEGHPQYLLKKLLSVCNVDRHSVRVLGDDPAAHDRLFLISELMRPGESTEKWQSLIDPAQSARIENALNGITRCDCETEDEEANVIALSMLEIAADPAQEKTATLITPDRQLAMRVQSCLAQWGVTCDDSAGVALAATPVGRFMLSVPQSVSQNDINPIAFLNVLKSPQAGGGASWQFDKDYRTLVRLLERHVFRGVRPAGGFDGMRRHVSANENHPEILQGFINHLETLFAPLTKLTADRHDLATFITAHITVMENMAARPDMDGASRLWSGDAGVALAQFLTVLQGQNDITPPMTMREYADFMERMVAGQNINIQYGSHPRLTILGQIEARMVKADRVILGGLNEGTWPPDTGFDAWMSRPMRTDFGLPALEQKVTLAAHDFASAFGAADLFLTRSIRVGGQPAIPARWLQRLDTILTAARLAPRIWPQQNGAAYIHWAKSAKGDAANARPVTRPMPKPPVNARPTSFSVTEIERWMRDPYALYAKKILGLKKLDMVDMDVTVADRGTLIHDILEKFVSAYPDNTWPQYAYDKLITIGKDVFAAKAEHPEIHGLWWPRFEKTAAWFIPHETVWRQGTQRIHTESKCSMDFTVNDTAFNLHGKADRLEKRRDGTWTVIDYKTGSQPQVGDVVAGLANQLPLEAYILLNGGFADIGAVEEVSDLQYWMVGGSGEGGKCAAATGKSDMKDVIKNTGEGVMRLISTFHDASVPYIASPNPHNAIKIEYNDYAHLARIAEWSVIGDGGDT